MSQYLTSDRLAGALPDPLALPVLYDGILWRRPLAYLIDAAIIGALFGAWLWLGYGVAGHWIHAKLVLVVLLVVYHFWMGEIAGQFARGTNRRSHVFYRWINEVPVVLLAGIVVLAVVKPF